MGVCELVYVEEGREHFLLLEQHIEKDFPRLKENTRWASPPSVGNRIYVCIIPHTGRAETLF